MTEWTSSACMNMFTIYVAGQIDDNNIEDALGWRKQVHTWAKTRGDVLIMDPLVDKKTRDIKERNFEPLEIMFRDLKYIDMCDVLLVYMPRDRKKKLTWGTPCEVMYAWMHRIPVIIVTDDFDVKSHYWVRCQAVRILNTINDALDYIEEYWMA